MQTKINCLIFHAALWVSYQRHRLTKRVLAWCTCHRRGISISFPLWPHKPVSRRSFTEILRRGNPRRHKPQTCKCMGVYFFFFLSCRLPVLRHTHFGFPVTFILYTAALAVSSKKNLKKYYVTHSLKKGSGKKPILP